MDFMFRGMLENQLKEKKKEEGQAELPQNKEAADLSFDDVLKVADMAYAAMMQDRFDKADEILSPILVITPRWGYAHALKGIVHLKAYEVEYKREKYNLDEAEKCLRRAIELEPNGIFAYVNLAEVLLYKGDLVGAADNLKLTKALDPDYKNPYTVRAYHFAMALMRALKRFEEQQLEGQPPTETPMA